MMKMKYKRISWTGSFIAGAVFIIVLAVLRYASGNPQDIRSRAGEQSGRKTSMSIRVMDMGNPLSVGVYVNTAGFPTAQADAVIVYDPSVLEIDEKEIRLLPAYKVIDIARPEPGVIMLSMFISDSIDSTTFSSSTDEPVAKLSFRSLVSGVESQITLRADPTSPVSSGLYPPRGDARGVVNILSGVSNLSVRTP